MELTAVRVAVTMRVVVVGTGSIGKRHGRLLCERSNVAVELCEPSASMLATALEEPWAAGLPVHSALEDALASRPHAVVLCTPHTLHAEQAITALDAGVRPRTSSFSKMRSPRKQCSPKMMY